MKGAEEIALEMIDKAGLTAKGWTFRFNDLKTCFGLCDFIGKSIEISWPVAVLNKKSDFVDTVKHEIAHALCRNGNHDVKWKERVIEMGGSTEATCDANKIKFPINYKLECLDCETEYQYGFYRRPRKARKCENCNTRKKLRVKPLI